MTAHLTRALDALKRGDSLTLASVPDGFDALVVADLTRWRIVDPQGFQTTVSLANLERNARVDQKLFVINYERILNDR